MFSFFGCCEASQATGDEVQVDVLCATPILEPTEGASRESASQPEGEALPRSFTCTLQRETRLDMDCAIYHSSLEITRIGEEGDAHKYNTSAPDGAKLVVGDHITSVNGERDPEKMLSAMQEGTTLQAEVVRPFRFNAKVAKQPESSVGMRINYTSTSAGVSIKSLAATGCIEGYNDVASEESKVKAGDLIVDLNGIGGKGIKMAAVMKDAACQELDFSLVRLGAAGA